MILGAQVQTLKREYERGLKEARVVYGSVNRNSSTQFALGSELLLSRSSRTGRCHSRSEGIIGSGFFFAIYYSTDYGCTRAYSGTEKPSASLNGSFGPNKIFFFI